MQNRSAVISAFLIFMSVETPGVDNRTKVENFVRRVRESHSDRSRLTGLEADHIRDGIECERDGYLARGTNFAIGMVRLFTMAGPVGFA